MTGQTIVALLALISTGLVAGLFFGWEVAVIPGLKRVDDRTYLLTMQHINQAIVNPVFLLPFLATPALLAAAYLLNDGAGNWLRLAAAVLYGIAVLGVTMTRNVPLNNELDRPDPASSAEVIGSARQAYEGRWNRWNRLRSLAALGSFVLVGLAELSPFPGA